jgi:hypothetical protein
VNEYETEQDYEYQAALDKEYRDEVKSIEWNSFLDFVNTGDDSELQKEVFNIEHELSKKECIILDNHLHSQKIKIEDLYITSARKDHLLDNAEIQLNQAVHESEQANNTIQATREAIQEIRSYLISPKFENEPYVNVSDIELRLLELLGILNS